MTIILYDVNSTCPEIAWSPSTWKTRYCLNLKGLKHKTEFVEYPDLEPLYKRLGVTPTVMNADGTPRYTVPLLYDPSTQKYITDSLAIADYLDATYPGPAIFPHGTRALQELVEGAYIGHIFQSVGAVSLAAVCARLTPVSDAYYRPKRMAWLGGQLPEGEALEQKWEEYKNGLGAVDKWFEKADGPFLMGKEVSWGDFVIASAIVWLRIIFGEDSKEWKNIESWHGGRWARLIGALRQYEQIL